MYKHRSKRTDRGSMAEGVAGLAVVIGGTVMGLLLIMNVGTAVYLKNRLGFMSEQAARYAANEKDGPKRHQFVRELSDKMGLGDHTSVVFENNIDVFGESAVRATLTSRVSTFGNVNWLPKSVKMTDSAVCTTDDGGLEIEGYVTGVVGSVGPTYNMRAVPIVKMTQKKPTFRGVVLGTTNPASVNFWMNFPQPR